MNDYEEKVYQEMMEWELKLLRNKSMVQRLSKKAQNKINSYIPEKAHTVITEAIKHMVKATLVGSDFTTSKKPSSLYSLEEKEKLVEEKITSYRKTAAIEGAGTGAGGILLGLADFPLLLSIKMKLLFELASIYGYDTKNYEERLFLLHIFQLAFANDDRKREVYYFIKHWEEEKEKLVDVDWRVFQQEYRDYIDLVKLFQMIPGIGAVVGAYANYNLVDQLGETAKNCYRLRIFGE
ncbi:EcsC family protein [Gracilibacillus dipsosauri]|uniref:ABC transporter-associated protein EcsC n=1 Tax=Gracilibacillus dipsosauri TaxID=178340 RepID=A0A317L7K4_9BACI|nr:EcsC family protein [Gracilibacillus dipsosauri]PWU69769.1 ABC transporter-associated protein EcsC [Gracilibacillus dipsosauri]